MIMKAGICKNAAWEVWRTIRMMDEHDNIVKIGADWNNERVMRIDLSVLGIEDKWEVRAIGKFAGKWANDGYEQTEKTYIGACSGESKDEENQRSRLVFFLGI